jgi:hypothetical protein
VQAVHSGRLAFCILCLATCAPARADEALAVSGDARALKVVANAAPTGEVIEAIAEKIEVPIAPPRELKPETITGTYEGSLADVLRGLLPQASFIVSRRTGDDRGLAVRFLDAPDAEAAAPVARADPAGEGGIEEAGDATDVRDIGQGRAAAPGVPAPRDPPNPVRQVY